MMTVVLMLALVTMDVDLGVFDKGQPADEFDDDHDDVLVVDDGRGADDGRDVDEVMRDGRDDRDAHDVHADVMTVMLMMTMNTLRESADSTSYNTNARYRKSCLYTSNERWECSWHTYRNSSLCSSYKCRKSCLCSSY